MLQYITPAEYIVRASAFSLDCDASFTPAAPPNFPSVIDDIAEKGESKRFDLRLDLNRLSSDDSVRLGAACGSCRMAKKQLIISGTSQMPADGRSRPPADSIEWMYLKRRQEVVGIAADPSHRGPGGLLEGRSGAQQSPNRRPIGASQSPFSASDSECHNATDSTPVFCYRWTSAYLHTSA
jgi:hypothetical protein